MREETLEEEDEDLQPDAADTEAEPEEAAPEARVGEPDETSLDEILEKPAAADEEEDEESILSLGSEEPLETLSVKIEPKKDTEFVCQKCYLVKPIRSQLADKGRMYCRDCA